MVDRDFRWEADGRQKAADFRNAHGLGTGPIKDVIDIAETTFRADVTLIELPSFLDSVTYRDPATSTVLIAVGTTDNPERQRFSVAHELGHLVFDELSVDVHTGEASSDAEIRAHAFARHFLIPEEALADYLAETDHSQMNLDERALSGVVSFFEVSATVAAIQLHRTGWISDRTFDDWEHLEASYLARRYGWAAERSVRTIESSTERPAKRMLDNATEAYINHFLEIETLAHINGNVSASALKESLELDGIAPRQTPSAPLSLDDLG